MTRVFVQLKGGLGNQLFQYAAGRAVAIRNSSELFLDTRIYTTNRHRLYSLDHFCIKARVAAPSQLPPPPAHHGSATNFGERLAVVLDIFVTTSMNVDMH